MLYDLATLKNMSNNDEVFIIDMLQTFKRTAPPILERMQQYVAEKKYEAAGREAHKMIPGVSFLGAGALKEVLVTIEEMGKKGMEHDGEFEKPVTTALEMTQKLITCFENDFPGKI